MGNAKWFTVSLVIFCCLLVGLGIFSFWSHGGLVDKAFGQRNPRVIVVGDIADFPPEVQADLPTGYQVRPGTVWDLLDEVGFTPADIDTRMLFLVERDVPGLSIANQLQWAKENGIEEAYFFYSPPLPPDVELVPLSGDDIIKEIRGITVRTLNLVFDALIPWADAHQFYGKNATGCGLTGTWPAGGCLSKFFTDDFSPDARIPMVTVCSTYESTTCHFISWYQHSYLNIATSDGNEDQEAAGTGYSQETCLDVHNGGSTQWYAPTRMTVKMWDSASAMGCGSGVCGCATKPNVTPPVLPDQQQVNLNRQMSCGKIDTIRHEFTHNYGYTDAQIGQQNLHQTKHCQSNHHIHNAD